MALISAVLATAVFMIATFMAAVFMIDALVTPCLLPSYDLCKCSGLGEQLSTRSAHCYIPRRKSRRKPRLTAPRRALALSLACVLAVVIPMMLRVAPVQMYTCTGCRSTPRTVVVVSGGGCGCCALTVVRSSQLVHPTHIRQWQRQRLCRTHGVSFLLVQCYLHPP